MPTSSIFTTVKITDPQKAEAFIKALEDAEKAPRIVRETPNMRYVTDPNEIKELMEKRKKREDKGLFTEQIPKELIEEG